MKQLIVDFYTAFVNLDDKEMVKHYHPDVVFEDPAFGVLKGEKANKMWEMLCHSQKGKEFNVTFNSIAFDGKNGHANWEAIYNFSKTGRKVHNKIKAEFEFKDGLIIKHTDTFNLNQWASQAMGLKGFLLGKTSFFQSKLQKTTHHLLDEYMKK